MYGTAEAVPFVQKEFFRSLIRPWGTFFISFPQKAFNFPQPVLPAILVRAHGEAGVQKSAGCPRGLHFLVLVLQLVELPVDAALPQ